MATNTIGAGVVLNEGQIDVDFRVEGNSAEYLLMVDGSSDCVGIGTAAPTAPLTIDGDATTGDSASFMQLDIQGATSSAKRLKIGYDTTLNAGVIYPCTTNVSHDNLLLCPVGGNVGIGVTDPDIKFHVETSNLYEIAKFENSASDGNCIVDIITTHAEGGDAGIRFNSRNAGANDVWTVGMVKDSDKFSFVGSNDMNDAQHKMTIQQDGNVGIGTTSPAELLHVYDATGGKLHLQSTGTDSWAYTIFQNDARIWRAGVRGDISDQFTIYDQTAGAGRFCIDSSGNVGIGTTAPEYNLQVDDSVGGNIFDLKMTHASECYGMIIRHTNQAVNNTTRYFLTCDDSEGNEARIQADGAYLQVSDRRKKENIEDTESQLDKVNQLQVRNYTRIGDATEHPHIGLIAQEVDDIYPHLVSVADDEAEHLLLYKTGMIPILLKAVQELSAKVEALENA